MIGRYKESARCVPATRIPTARESRAEDTQRGFGEITGFPRK